MPTQDQALRTNSIKSNVGCAEKESKQSVMWLQNVKCLHKNSTAYGNMIELV